MNVWGREKPMQWPEQKHLWKRVAFWATLAVLALTLRVQFESLSLVEKYYLPFYLKAGARNYVLPGSIDKYRLFYVRAVKGANRAAQDGEIESIKDAYDRKAYQLTDAARQRGLLPIWNDELLKNEELHAYLGSAVFGGQTAWGFAKYPVYITLFELGLMLCFAIPADNRRTLELVAGKRLRGPELLQTTEEWNSKTAKNRTGRPYEPGLAFPTEEGGHLARTKTSWAYISREDEKKHILLLGDTGAGKGAMIVRLLQQIRARGECAVIFDPEGEYAKLLSQAGDTIVNPMDARCPYWTPADEIRNEAEALTVATALFADKDLREPFFNNAARETMALLMSLKLPPKELVRLMCNPTELIRLTKGTPAESMIAQDAVGQKSGVLGTLNMIANAFKTLPEESETKEHWSTLQWLKNPEQRGFVFITTTDDSFKRTLPLTSMWLDLLLLRARSEKEDSRRKWFILDELASLQYLPQLQESIVRLRKSNGCLILGFHGKAQIEALYGPVWETMLSQETTKFFLKTNGHTPAKWISDEIGKMEIVYYDEVRTTDNVPQARTKVTYKPRIVEEQIVMPEQIMGMDDLHGFLQYRNFLLVLRYLHPGLPKKCEGFVERGHIDPLPPPPQNNQPDHYFE